MGRLFIAALQCLQSKLVLGLSAHGKNQTNAQQTIDKTDQRAKSELTKYLKVKLCATELSVDAVTFTKILYLAE
jgi:hypothetical protein